MHLPGCGVAASNRLLSTCRPLVKEPPKMVLRRILGPSLETGAIFDTALSGNYCRIADCVSVRAVLEKCDEKGLGSASGHRNVRCRQFGRAPFGYPPRLRSGLRQNRLPIYPALSFAIPQFSFRDRRSWSRTVSANRSTSALVPPCRPAFSESLAYPEP